MVVNSLSLDGWNAFYDYGYTWLTGLRARILLLLSRRGGVAGAGPGRRSILVENRAGPAGWQVLGVGVVAGAREALGAGGGLPGC